MEHRKQAHAEPVQRSHDLIALRHRWGEEYDIGWDEEFVARRREGGLLVFAATADGLHRALEFDLSTRTFPRHHG